MIIPVSFYQNDDVAGIARALLGKTLGTEINGQYTSGIIVETEAYAGVTDKASHAYGGRFTNRTRVMYEDGGIAYVYLCYGIHHLFNIVTHGVGTPHAVLIRAIEPANGIDIMLQRRGKAFVTPTLTAGPGALSAALGITTLHTGYPVTGPVITISDTGYTPEHITAATRVGVAYAREDALLPLRFYISGNKFVSKGKGL